MKNKGLSDFGTALAAFVVTVIMILIFSILFAWPIMILWNWLMPAIFGLTKVTFWQAWGLSFLSGLLFKSSSVSDK